MKKVTALSVFSFLVLGLLVVATLVPPAPAPRTESPAPRPVEDIALTPAGDGWRLSIVLANHEEEYKGYTVQVSVDGVVRGDETIVPRGRRYSYTQRIAPSELSEGAVRVQVFEARNLTPLEETTYHLKGRAQ
ncbi:MAG: hypothetical protein HYY02_12725 [Chloroflexi bacterium]|nr:hypothetical protein [Chloroflexota bacterium]